MTTLPALRPAPRTTLLALLVAATYAVELLVVRSAAFVRAPDAIAAAVAFDLAVVVPLAWWWLVVRSGAVRTRTLLPVVALSLLGARLVLPADHRSFLGLARWLTAPLEIALVVGAVGGVRRAMREARARGETDAHAPDAAESLEGALRGVLGAGVARVVGAELATLYYALLARRRPIAPRTRVVARESARSASLAWGVALVIAVESVAMHLWLVTAHPVLAWTLTAMGIYSLLWIAGQYRASALRVTVLTDDALVVRVGLRLSARLTHDEIASISRVDWRTRPAPAADYLDVARPGEPNVLLTLRAPTTVTAALGLRRTVTRIGLRVDDPTTLDGVTRGGAARPVGV